MDILKEKRIDSYLKIVLVKRGSEYATYLYNETYGGYASGNYFDSYEEAKRDYEGRS